MIRTKFDCDYVLAKLKQYRIILPRVFRDYHPCGQPFEIYILTSKKGAERIRERAGNYDYIGDRIDSILIPHSPEDDDNDIDIESAAELFYHKFDMKIINHDGGKEILRTFCRRKALTQINLTLCRGYSQRSILCNSPSINDATRSAIVDDFDNQVQSFFSRNGEQRGIPQTFEKVAVYVGVKHDDAVIISFDVSKANGF